MSIRNTKQNWTKGATVKVGFLTLVVQAVVATPGDGLPDLYFLSNQSFTKLYQFIPHNGLTEVTVEEAQEKVREMTERTQAIFAQNAARAAQQAATRAQFAQVFGGVAA